jgi:transcriptional regulator with XRE-family HTH domain
MQTSYRPQKGSGKSPVGDAKAPVVVMTNDRKREVVAQLTDDVLSKLTGAFFDVCKFERWTKRDLSSISGINETAIGHILAGRRKNLTVETIALLARAMGVRPELVLHDTRPVGNQPPAKSAVVKTFTAHFGEQHDQSLASVFSSKQAPQSENDLQKTTLGATAAAYARPSTLVKDDAQ